VIGTGPKRSQREGERRLPSLFGVPFGPWQRGRIGFTAGFRTYTLPSSSSLMVFGPTRSGKTRSVVIPNLNGWNEPFLATSLKDDLLPVSGNPMVIGINPKANASWWPALEAISEKHAREMASSLIGAQPGNHGAENRFWYQLSEAPLAAVLRVSSLTGLTELDLLGSLRQALRILEQSGETSLADDLRSVLETEPKARDSIITTMRSALLPLRSWPRDKTPASVTELIEKQVFLIAPLVQVRQSGPVISSLISIYLRRVLVGPGRRRLLVLDELGNFAPIPELAQAASVGMGLGLELISILQDFSQLELVYGRAASSMVNNHRSKLFLPGIDDPNTKALMSSFGITDSNHAHLVLSGRSFRVRWKRST
jgi:type IV secretory pathway TraG/TraD family ATPase VirD4